MFFFILGCLRKMDNILRKIWISRKNLKELDETDQGSKINLF